MGQKTIQLNESQLQSIVAESVRRILKEDIGDMMGMYDGEDGSTNEPEGDVAEEMWNQVLEWRKLGWIDETQADQIRDIIGA